MYVCMQVLIEFPIIMQVIRGLTAPGNRTEWSMGAELGRLSVQYHMGHTLTVSLGLGGGGT